MSRRGKIIISLIGTAVAGFLIIQVIPIGSIRAVFQRHPNPPVLTTIQWNSPETEKLVRSACYACHSNETVYPWYSNIAPVSWLVTRDVNRGRTGMNFSEDAEADYNLADIEAHLNHDMPPRIYLLTHPEASLTDEQKAMLLAGFQATLTKASHEGMNMNGE